MNVSSFSLVMFKFPGQCVFENTPSVHIRLTHGPARRIECRGRRAQCSMSGTGRTVRRTARRPRTASRVATASVVKQGDLGRGGGGAEQLDRWARPASVQPARTRKSRGGLHLGVSPGTRASGKPTGGSRREPSAEGWLTGSACVRWDAPEPPARDNESNGACCGRTGRG